MMVFSLFSDSLDHVVCVDDVDHLDRVENCYQDDQDDQENKALNICAPPRVSGHDRRRTQPNGSKQNALHTETP